MSKATDRPERRSILKSLLGATALFLAMSGGANAVPISTTIFLTDFTNGGGFFAEVLLEDTATNQVSVTVDIADPINADLTQGDILGIWFDVNDASVLGGLSHANGDPTGIVTAFLADEDMVGSVGGNNNNLGGGGQGNSRLFDIGVALGANGSGGGGFVQTLSFDLIFTPTQSSTSTLSTALFVGEDVGVRVQSINSPTFGTGASSKLLGVTPPPPEPPTDVPTPGSLALLGIGALGLGFARRRRRG